MRAIVCLIICFAYSSVLRAEDSNERTASSFVEVEKEALNLGKVYGGNEKVLLVFDVDNTLLAMRQDLGSAQWFAWQADLPANASQSVGDFAELLRVQSLLYSISSMRVTHPGQAEIVKRLQDSGFKTLLLTSRGFDLRDATRRELRANKYDFKKSALPISGIKAASGFDGPYCPYKQSDVELSGVSRKEAERWLAVRNSDPVDIKKPRPISYSEGVCMTAGQHKGAMLRMLLHKTNNAGKFKAIVFVDDGRHHTKNVREAFEDQPEELVTFRYSREDSNVDRFNANQSGAKDQVIETWNELKKTLDALTSSTLNAISAPPLKCVP